MLSLDDTGLQILMQAAVLILPPHRGQFLTALANDLLARPDCSIAQAVNDLQRRWKWSPTSTFDRRVPIRKNSESGNQVSGSTQVNIS